MGQISNAANVVMLGNASKVRGIESGIRDSADDWLSRQLKEEREALYRMREMFGIGHFASDAEKLKKEHEIRHEAARRKGLAR